MDRLKVLVTRRWPEEVERALQERFEVVLDETDRPLRQEELARAMGTEVACNFSYVDSIPLTASGKLRVTVSELS